MKIVKGAAGALKVKPSREVDSGFGARAFAVRRSFGSDRTRLSRLVPSRYVR